MRIFEFRITKSDAVSMILSKNRFALFRIMRYASRSLRIVNSAQRLRMQTAVR